MIEENWTKEAQSPREWDLASEKPKEPSVPPNQS
jgi:hypothetical protein